MRVDLAIATKSEIPQNAMRLVVEELKDEDDGRKQPVVSSRPVGWLCLEEKYLSHYEKSENNPIVNEVFGRSRDWNAGIREDMDILRFQFSFQEVENADSSSELGSVRSID